MTLNKITNVLPCPSKKGYVDIFVDGELFLTVTEDAFFEADLKIGAQIDEQKLLEIEAASLFAKAKNKAYSLLSYGSMSKKTLAQKLSRSGYEQDVCQSVCNALEKQGYIDDEQYAISLYSYLANTKLYGPRRIFSEMTQKGIDRQLIEQISSSAQTDFEQNIKSLAFGKLKKDLKDKKEVSRLISSLLRYGYDYEQITGALSGLEEQIDD